MICAACVLSSVSRVSSELLATWGWFQLETPVVVKWWLNLMSYNLSLSNQADGTIEII